ncbi:carboxymuconolactone decarboxylase family protein [Streptomyces sp. NPDC093675]|uniref:carboxymuconolactone decarboxylase family protein n=1 Tax=unclassified Streptomyces TaxID=2593676 RepID=UPI003690AF47
MTARTTRLDAAVRTALQAIGATSRRGLDDPALAELVQVRASQPNHRAFCPDTHLAGARPIPPGSTEW